MTIKVYDGISPDDGGSTRKRAEMEKRVVARVTGYEVM